MGSFPMRLGSEMLRVEILDDRTAKMRAFSSFSPRLMRVRDDFSFLHRRQRFSCLMQR